MRLLDHEHPSTLIAISSLASTHARQKHWEDAEKLQIQVIETSTRVLGPEHPDTTQRISNLAITYSYQDRWKEAQPLQEQALDMSSKVMGTNILLC